MLDSLRAWCEAADLEVVEERRTRTGLSMRLERRGAEPAPVDVVLSPEGEVRWVRTERALPASLAQTFAPDELVQRLAEARAGLLEGNVETRDGSPLAVFQYPLDSEGLTRMAFLAAVAEVGKSRRSLERALQDMERGREEMARLQEALKGTGEGAHAVLGRAESEAQAALDRMRERLQPKPAEPPPEPEPAPPPPPPPTPPPKIEPEPAPPPAGPVACKSCGKALKSDSRFCTACGTPV